MNIGSVFNMDGTVTLLFPIPTVYDRRAAELQLTINQLINRVLYFENKNKNICLVVFYALLLNLRTKRVGQNTITYTYYARRYSFLLSSTDFTLSFL